MYVTLEVDDPSVSVELAELNPQYLLYMDERE
jgi:hypothetical protein